MRPTKNWKGRKLGVSFTTSSHNNKRKMSLQVPEQVPVDHVSSTLRVAPSARVETSVVEGGGVVGRTNSLGSTCGSVCDLNIKDRRGRFYLCD